MKEINAIINAYNAIDASKTQAALATVIRVEGSSYRREGARMLVMDDGNWIGGISGGCLEGDALKRARLAIVKSTPSMITYDTTEDDAHQIGVGLGCNGIIDVLFTPLDFSNKYNPVEILKSCLGGERKTNILLTITGVKGNWSSLHPGDVIHFKEPGCLTIFNDANLEKRLIEKINLQVNKGKSSSFQVEWEDGKMLSLFIEILLPEIHSIIMGHQYDAYPLARLSKELGWKVSIIANPLKVNSSLSSIADDVIPNEQFLEIPFDNYSAILLMSHDYKTDTINLVKAVQTNVPYIGLLGPRIRAEKILRELEEQNQPVIEKDRERIYAPAGLDIGAQSPEEIALALLAEIKSVLSNRSGGFLRLRPSPIHERS